MRFVRIRLHPWGVITAAGTVATTATLCGFLGSCAWFLDVFCHFRVQYCAGLTAASLLLLIPRHFKSAAVFSLAALINLATILPFYLGAEAQASTAVNSLRALLLNVSKYTGSPKLTAQTIRGYDPDIVVLEEITDYWMEQLRAAMEPYPYRRAEHLENCLGMSLFSKLPFKRAEVLHMGIHQLPWIVATIETGQGDLTVVTARSLPPFNRRFSRIRNNLLNEIPGIVESATPPVLLLGDLNITPWSPHFKHLLARTGLRNSSQGRGILPTWPAQIPLLLIPIDHCLHSEGIRILSKRIGPYTGSDHYPVIVDFALQPTGRAHATLTATVPRASVVDLQ